MIKYLLLFISLNAIADDRIDYACKHLGNVAKVGHKLKAVVDNEMFVLHLATRHDGIEKQALELGYGASNPMEAFELGHEMCVNWEKVK
jgi:hypothetical protein